VPAPPVREQFALAALRGAWLEVLGRLDGQCPGVLTTLCLRFQSAGASSMPAKGAPGGGCQVILLTPVIPRLQTLGRFERRAGVVGRVVPRLPKPA